MPAKSSLEVAADEWNEVEYFPVIVEQIKAASKAGELP